MNHGPHAVSIAQATANFFVNEGEAYVFSYLYLYITVLLVLGNCDGLKGMVDKAVAD